MLEDPGRKKQRRGNTPVHAGSPDPTKVTSEWFTPPHIVERVRAVIGPIDLDPFSEVAANLVVQAVRFYSLEDEPCPEGASGPLVRSAYTNPPYGRGLIGPAIDRFLMAWQLERFKKGIMTLNNITETSYGAAAMRAARMVHFPDKRTSFTAGHGQHDSGNPSRGQMPMLFSEDRADAERFVQTFASYGLVLPTRGFVLT